MLTYFILFLIPVTVISLNNLDRNSTCQSSSISCSSRSSDNNDKRISKKIHLDKLNLKKKFKNKQLSVAYVEGDTRSRIQKRSTSQGSLDDDSDLIAPPTRRSITSFRKARRQGISTKQTIDKNRSKVSKIIKNRSETEQDIKCNSRELKKLMLESISENSSASKRAINDRAEAKFGGSIDVICSKGHFSYVYSSNLYCEAMKNNVTCIAFRQSL